jgi:hypothetical protein
MSQVTSITDKIEGATEVLSEVGKLEGGESDQKLHRATFDTSVLPKTDENTGDSLDEKISELLDEIGQGLRADDATKFEKLTIARKYGPMLLELKELAPRGTFKSRLKERFPKVNYAKCNRWMFIGKHEAEVAAAIEKYPEVAWGPKKMIDFLKGWNPDEEQEYEEDEADGYLGVEKDEEYVGEVEVVPSTPTNPDSAAAQEANQQEHDVNSQDASPGAAADTATEVDPVKRIDHEVEVRLGFKLSVPENVTAEEIANALREAENWTVRIKTPFEFEMSEKGIRVSHVRPWDSHGQCEPEAIPSDDN